MAAACRNLPPRQLDDRIHVAELELVGRALLIAIIAPEVAIHRRGDRQDHRRLPPRTPVALSNGQKLVGAAVDQEAPALQLREKIALELAACEFHARIEERIGKTLGVAAIDSNDQTGRCIEQNDVVASSNDEIVTRWTEGRHKGCIGQKIWLTSAAATPIFEVRSG